MRCYTVKTELLPILIQQPKFRKIITLNLVDIGPSQNINRTPALKFLKS